MDDNDESVFLKLLILESRVIMAIIETCYAQREGYKKWRSLSQSRSVCLVVEASVAASYRLPLAIFHMPNRSSAPIAFARQIAMYVAHVWLGLSLTEVGRYFGRDRTTVSHACQVVEDRRENRDVDRIVSSIETTVDKWLQNSSNLGDEQ